MAAGHEGAGTRPANGRQGARTPKSAATREKIMRAAAELMVERGDVEFQMGEVSARCGLSKGSLYYYFADRSALVRAVFDRSVDDLVGEVEAVVASAPSAAASILGLVRALADAVRPGGPLMLAMVNRPERAAGAAAGLVEESRLSRVVDILTAQVERAKGEGLVRPEVNGRLAAAAVAGAFLVFEHVAPAGPGTAAEPARRSCARSSTWRLPAWGPSAGARSSPRRWGVRARARPPDVWLLRRFPGVRFAPGAWGTISEPAEQGAEW